MTGFHKRKKKRRKEAEKNQEEAQRRKRLEERKKVRFLFSCFPLNVSRLFRRSDTKFVVEANTLLTHKNGFGPTNGPFVPSNMFSYFYLFHSAVCIS